MKKKYLYNSKLNIKDILANVINICKNIFKYPNFVRFYKSRRHVYVSVWFRSGHKKKLQPLNFKKHKILAVFLIFYKNLNLQYVKDIQNFEYVE